MSLTGDNGHTIPKVWGSCVFWRDGIACGVLDEWTHVEITVRYTGTGDLTFRRSEINAFNATVNALDLAFAKGKHARSREFNALLNNTGFGV